MSSYIGSGVVLDTPKLISFHAQNFMCAMQDYVNFSRTPAVQKANIEIHTRLTLEQIHPYSLQPFKDHIARILAQDNGSDHWLCKLDLQNTSPAHIEESICSLFRNKNWLQRFGDRELRAWASFYLSSQVYKPYFLSLTVLMGAFSLGIFNKSNNKDSSTSA